MTRPTGNRTGKKKDKKKSLLTQEGLSDTLYIVYALPGPYQGIPGNGTQKEKKSIQREETSSFVYEHSNRDAVTSENPLSTAAWEVVFPVKSEFPCRPIDNGAEKSRRQPPKRDKREPRPQGHTDQRMGHHCGPGAGLNALVAPTIGVLGERVARPSGQKLPSHSCRVNLLLMFIHEL
jgi:hypothetical protein